MRKHVVALVVCTLALVSAASAAEGRIPVLSLAGPTYHITAPGYYILTRNVEFGGGSVIQIESDDVTLDLGGHTVTGPTSFVAAAIFAAPGSGTRLVTIKNGQVFGGSEGISSVGSGRIRVEGLDVSGSIGGIGINADHAEILDCHVHDLVTPFGSAGGGIGLNAVGGRVTGNLIQNVPGSGLVLNGLHGGEVRHNVIRAFGSVAPGAIGIDLEETSGTGGTGGNIVADNTVDGLGVISDDIGILIQSPFNLVSGNVVTNNGSVGILVRHNQNRLERNLTDFNGTDGIQVRLLTQGNRLEGNQSSINKGCGVNLTGSVTAIYSNSTLISNSGGNVCGVGINAGGNYCDATVCP